MSSWCLPDVRLTSAWSPSEIDFQSTSSSPQFLLIRVWASFDPTSPFWVKAQIPQQGNFHLRNFKGSSLGAMFVCVCAPEKLFTLKMPDAEMLNLDHLASEDMWPAIPTTVNSGEVEVKLEKKEADDKWEEKTVTNERRRWQWQQTRREGIGVLGPIDCFRTKVVAEDDWEKMTMMNERREQ